MGKVIALLPATAGAALGIYLTLFPAGWKLIALGAALLGLLALLYAADQLFSTAPRLWGWLLETWILFLPVATGLAIYAMLWLTTIVKPDDLIPVSALLDDQKKVVIKYGVAALGALLAALVAGDPAKAENPFWPSAQFKRLAARMAPSTSIGNEPRWSAAVGESTRMNEVRGWGFAARRFRAIVLDG